MTTEARAQALLMSIRQALIIAIGAIEDYLGIQRSIVPRRKRATVRTDSSAHGVE